jgi:hypothetical protein
MVRFRRPNGRATSKAGMEKCLDKMAAIFAGASCVVAVATHAQTLEGRNEEWLTTR